VTLGLTSTHKWRWLLGLAACLRVHQGLPELEDVQLLDLTGIRTMVALSWVAAGFLYELGVTLEWPEVQLIAKLGGWEYHKGRKPGKIILTRGLHRIMDMLTIEAFLNFLNAYIREHGELPPRIAALLKDWTPRRL
jgi:hypothetical protein